MSDPTPREQAIRQAEEILGYKRTAADSLMVIRALLDQLRAEPQVHRCSGCGHRWDGELKGAELCGDCWRKVQPVMRGRVEGPPPQLDDAEQKALAAGLADVKAGRIQSLDSITAELKGRAEGQPPEDVEPLRDLSTPSLWQAYRKEKADVATLRQERDDVIRQLQREEAASDETIHETLLALRTQREHLERVAQESSRLVAMLTRRRSRA